MSWSTQHLHYLGVGFDRNSTTTNDLFNSPTANAFLHITNTHNGTDLTPGYSLTPSDENSSSGLTLGITNTDTYNVIDLTANPNVPGDFYAQESCYRFPNAPTPNLFCGSGLLDVGIDSMFIDLPKSQCPAGTYNENNKVPEVVKMTITMGTSTTPAMQYSFNAVEDNPPSDSPTPKVVKWINSTKSGLIFVNTGRRPLYIYNSLYNGQCGQVGFKSLQ